MLLTVLTVCILTAHASASAPAVPTDPRVEYAAAELALGIDRSVPRFGWKLPRASGRGEQQAAYQLTITEQGSTTSLFDSKKIPSNRSQFISPPNGTAALKPDASYDWAVRWYSSLDPSTPSPWLRATFSTGIGSGSDLTGWKGAQWIVPTKVRGEGSGNQMRKHFTLPAGKAITRAGATDTLSHFSHHFSHSSRIPLSFFSPIDLMLSQHCTSHAWVTSTWRSTASG